MYYVQSQPSEIRVPVKIWALSRNLYVRVQARLYAEPYLISWFALSILASGQTGSSYPRQSHCSFGRWSTAWLSTDDQGISGENLRQTSQTALMVALDRSTTASESISTYLLHDAFLILGAWGFSHRSWFVSHSTTNSKQHYEEDWRRSTDEANTRALVNLGCGQVCKTLHLTSRRQPPQTGHWTLNSVEDFVESDWHVDQTGQAADRAAFFVDWRGTHSLLRIIWLGWRDDSQRDENRRHFVGGHAGFYGEIPLTRE